jgi:CSLREA domain-containing protein
MPIMRSISLSLILLYSMSLFASTYVVNDLGDASDQTAGDDVCATPGAVCTLRAAIEEANAHAGADVITFGVTGAITPGTLFAAITQQVDIDATTAPGYVGTPIVTISGGGSIATGLTFAAGSSSSQVQGLKIHGFTSAAVSIASANVVVRRNYLGPIGGGVANQWGIVTLPSSAACTIGGVVDGDGNVISGNSDSGLMIGGSDHTIADNFIGTNASGSAALANGQSGIYLDAVNVTIGVIGAGLENLIAGNTRFGVFQFGSSLISPTHIANNIIGLNPAANTAIPNGQAGIFINSGAVVIGSPAGGNVISGNTECGIEIRGGVATVQNNIIGLDGTGQTAIGNVADGILVGAPSTIGGTAVAEGNTISGNQRNGIGVVSAGGGSTIFGNTIGLNVNRTIARGNAVHGIELNTTFGPDNVQIGTAAGGMNVISGNGQDGINGAATNSSISHNRIGTDGTGSIDLGNAGDGIELVIGVPITSNLIPGTAGGESSWAV